MPLSYFTALMVRGDRVRVHAVRRSSPDAHVGTLYLRKSSLPNGRIPRALTVTINEDPRYA